MSNCVDVFLLTNLIFLFILVLWEVKNIKSVQQWINVDEIYEDGIIKLKNNTYIKILKISPINYNLKSELEKEAILNSYKQFLKSCNFDIQILIQSSKENLNHHIEKVRNCIPNANSNYFKSISENYIEYISNFNLQNKSASKKFYVILSTKLDGKEYTNSQYQIQKEELQEMYFKVQSFLSRIGNLVNEKNTRDEVIEILKIFFVNT